MINFSTHRLRWAFHYSDHKPSIYGMWDQPAIHNTDMASFKNKENLLTASIEGKCLKTKKIVTLAQCNGQDFVNFQWIAAASSKLNVGPTGFKPKSSIIGLMLVTRDKKVKIYRNGFSELFEHKIDYGKFNLAGFGR